MWVKNVWKYTIHNLHFNWKHILLIFTYYRSTLSTLAPLHVYASLVGVDYATGAAENKQKRPREVKYTNLNQCCSFMAFVEETAGPRRPQTKLLAKVKLPVRLVEAFGKQKLWTTLDKYVIWLVIQGEKCCRLDSISRLHFLPLIDDLNRQFHIN